MRTRQLRFRGIMDSYDLGKQCCVYFDRRGSGPGAIDVLVNSKPELIQK